MTSRAPARTRPKQALCAIHSSPTYKGTFFVGNQPPSRIMKASCVRDGIYLHGMCSEREYML